MTRTVCRAIAVWRRTWDWSSPKQSLPNSKSSSAGQRSPAARIGRDRRKAAERPGRRSAPPRARYVTGLHHALWLAGLSLPAAAALAAVLFARADHG